MEALLGGTAWRHRWRHCLEALLEAPLEALTEALTGALALPAGCLNRNFGASKQLQRWKVEEEAMVARGLYQYLVTIAAALGC